MRVSVRFATRALVPSAAAATMGSQGKGVPVLAAPLVSGRLSVGAPGGKATIASGWEVEVSETPVGTMGAECTCVAVGKETRGRMGGLTTPPPPDDGAGVLVGRGGTGVIVAGGVSEGVTPGGKVWLGVLVEVSILSKVEVGEDVSEGVTPGTGVSVAVCVAAGVSVPVGGAVKLALSVAEAVSVGIEVNVLVETGGGGEP